MSAPPPQAVFTKTPQGSDEVATRRHGLPMRMRQLLILVDGRRTVADLSKLVPEKDLQANLPLLESQGFVTRAGAQGSPAGDPSAAAGAAPSAAPPQAGAAPHAGTVQQTGAVPLVPARVAPAAAPFAGTLGTGPAAAPVGAPSQPGQSGAAPASVPGAAGSAGPATLQHAPGDPAPQRRDLETIRRGVVRQLVDAIGPHGDDMAVRVERCRSVDELRQVLPAAAALVEAIRGRSAMAAFLQRVGSF